MTLENNNLKKKLTDGSFEELYKNSEDFKKLNCAKNTEEVLKILNKYGYNENSEVLTKEVLELLNEIRTEELRNVSGGKSLGHNLGAATLALLAGLTPNVGVTATTDSDVRLTTTTLEDKLLDQALSEAKKNRKKHSPSLLLPIIQHALEIGVPPVVTLLINHFRDTAKMSKGCKENEINNKESSALPVLDCLYNELKDSLQINFASLDALQQSQLITFTHHLLQPMEKKLHYLENKKRSSYEFLTEIFSAYGTTCRADMLILRTVEAYLNLSMTVGHTPTTSTMPEQLLVRFHEKLPNSPVTHIIQKLVHSANSETVKNNALDNEIIEEDSYQNNELDDVEGQAFADVDMNNYNSYQQSEINDEEYGFDLTHSQTENQIEEEEEEEEEDYYQKEDENQDQDEYRAKQMNYNTAVDYLKRIKYLSNVRPLTDDGENSIWTIGGDYTDYWCVNENLTLQKHIENYNDKLKSGEIAYDGNEELVLIELVDTEDGENDYDFLGNLDE